MSASAGTLTGVVGEIEGSPAGVRGVASSWRQAAATVSEGAGLVGSAQASVGSWQGQAAQAFTAATSQLDGHMGDVAAALTTGAEALDAYASVLEAAQHAAAELRAQAASLADSTEGDSAATVATAAALAGLAASFAALRAQVESAAAQAAATLGAASPPSTSTGTVVLTASGGRFETKKFTSKEIETLKKQAGEGSSHDWEDWPAVIQGNFSNCYLMGSLETLSSTQVGRQILRNNIRWDESQQAFIVTFYDRGKKVEIAVDDYYVKGNGYGDGDGDGDRERIQPPSLPNIYERAYGKYLVNHTDDSDLSWGYSADSTEAITGRPVEKLYNGSQNEYTDKDSRKIDEAVRSGVPVTASISEGGGIVDAHHDTNQNGRIDPNEQQVQRYELVDRHVYAVVDIDDDYVTIRNPWGANRQPNGTRTDGGTIRISREDYERYFTSTEVVQLSWADWMSPYIAPILHP